MSIQRLILSMFSVVLALAGTSRVYSQDYPSKPIRIFTGVAGGGNDFYARLIAQGISGPLGQPVIIENRPSILATEMAAKAPPDGYSLTYSGSGVLIRPLLTKSNVDPLRDLAPISMAATTLFVLIVHPSLPVKSVKELIALAKARPGDLNYGNGGHGSTQHLAAELFKSMAGANIVLVSYRSTTAALTGLHAGEVQVFFAELGTARAAVHSGRGRALAVTSLNPSPLYPGLPTVAASLPGYEMVAMDFVATTGGTPPPIINLLNREIVRVLSSPDVKEKYLARGTEATPSTPQYLAAKFKTDMTVMGKVIKDANIKLEE